jgi:hypothetical protein
VPLPLAHFKKEAKDILKKTGIKDSLYIGKDTIFLVYIDSTRLQPAISLDVFFEFSGSDVLSMELIPFELDFITENDDSLAIDIFKEIKPKGSKLYFSEPMFTCLIRNYIGSNTDLHVEYIRAIGEEGTQDAIFNNNTSSCIIKLPEAPEPYAYTEKLEFFDKDNGALDQLFLVDPDYIKYRFRAEVLPPDDGNPHFIVKDKYIDITYEAKLPIAFNPGTRLVNNDTLSLNLSDTGILENIDDFTLWMKFSNKLPAVTELEIVFLDENKQRIPEFKEKDFMIDASEVNINGYAEEGKVVSDLEISFTPEERQKLEKINYIIINYIVRSKDDRKANLHPSDYIEFKMEAYSKINIEL